jgi:hypothetical protein
MSGLYHRFREFDMQLFRRNRLDYCIWQSNGCWHSKYLNSIKNTSDCIDHHLIAAPRLRPLFKDKQIVEGSDGCGLFVDNFYFLKIVLFCVFYRVSIGLRCFNLRIMNSDLSGLWLLSFLFQCVKVATTIFFPPKKGHKGFHIFTKLFLFFYSVTRSQN